MIQIQCVRFNNISFMTPYEKKNVLTNMSSELYRRAVIVYLDIIEDFW